MGAKAIEATIIPDRGVALRRTLRLESDGGFGLLERREEGWTVCIPHGARARLRGRPLDLHTLALEPSGERRIRLTSEEIAVDLAGFRFEVRPVSDPAGLRAPAR